MARTIFEENFYQTYLELAQDKVANVRLEFAKSLIDIKPYLDSKTSINTELIESISKLKYDVNQEVVEATETADFDLLKSRKKILQVLQEKEDKCVLRIKKLDEREALEAEEKRKRMEEDDQYDYLGSYGQSNRNGAFKGTGKTRGFRAGQPGNTTTTNTKNTRKISTSAVTEKTKRKNVTSSSKSALPELNQAVSTTSEQPNTKRKQSVLLPQTSHNNMIETNKKQPGAGAQSQIGTTNTYKRSNSLLAPSKIAGKKDQQPGAIGYASLKRKPMQMKSGMDSSSESSEDDTPTARAKAGTNSTTAGMSFSSKAKQQ